MDIQYYQERHTAAKAKVAEYEAFKASLPSKMQAAAAALDPEAAIKLRKVADELPQTILAVRIGEQRAALELATAKRRADQKRREALQEQAAPLAEQIRELQKQLAPLVNEMNLLLNRDQSHIDREKTARRKMESLIAELQNEINVESAPVVRSIPHRTR